MRFITAAAVFAFAAVASAAPTQITADPSQGVTAFQGTASWTNFGLGSCGWNNNDNEMVTGVSPGVMGNNAKCGACATVTGNSGQSVKVKIVDKCMGCADTGLNLSPAAFQALGYPLGMGRAPINWVFSAC
ncbi:barwin-like endoglucanase [Ramicandelaber brevisporus]|nr:barwin-like endoglucanase [Ramicandelaber brevisporus]